MNGPAMKACLAVTVLAVAVQSTRADDEARLKGVWTVKSMTAEGQKIPLPADAQIVIDKDSLTFKAGPQTQKMPMTLDPSKSPKQIDLVSPTPPGVKLKELNTPGIYKLDGDKLHICMAALEVSSTARAAGEAPPIAEDVSVKVGKRPGAFDDKDGVLFVLERKKD